MMRVMVLWPSDDLRHTYNTHQSHIHSVIITYTMIQNWESLTDSMLSQLMQKERLIRNPNPTSHRCTSSWHWSWNILRVSGRQHRAANYRLSDRLLTSLITSGGDNTFARKISSIRYVAHYIDLTVSGDDGKTQGTELFLVYNSSLFSSSFFSVP